MHADIPNHGQSFKHAFGARQLLTDCKLTAADTARTNKKALKVFEKWAFIEFIASGCNMIRSTAIFAFNCTRALLECLI